MHGPLSFAIPDDLRPGEQLGPHFPRQRESGGVEASRRSRTEIDDLRTIGASLVHHHKADPA